MGKTKRALIDVLYAILEVADKKDGVNKTAIVYNANLNFLRAEEHIMLLINHGLLNVTGDRTKYRTTEKGREFLQRYRSLLQLISHKDDLRG
ncbi:MAG: winged helix-turn-helix domain-containing protein [Candidatus Methanosuratincola sp.]